MSQFKKHRSLMALRIRHHLFIGFTAALSLSLISFEWTTYNEDIEHYAEAQAGSDILDVPEIMPFKRKVPTIKVSQILDRFKITDILDEDNRDEEPDLKDLAKNIKVFDFGNVTDLDIPDDEEFEIGGEIIDYGLLQNRPHFADCANVEDKNLQDQCTYLKIKTEVSSKLRYPRICVEQGVQGKVELTFVIDDQGNIAEVEVVKSVDPRLDRAAIAAIKALPKFVPGRVMNKNVSVRYQMPVAFKIGS